jgi:hypothetical protein
MATAIRDVTGSDLRLFGDIVARLERLGSDRMRARSSFSMSSACYAATSAPPMSGTRAKNRFDEAVRLNMERSNLRSYEEWYQFRDPMTFELRAPSCHAARCSCAPSSTTTSWRAMVCTTASTVHLGR